MVISACTGLGVSAGIRLKERRRVLEKLRKMVSHLRGEILYSNVPLPEAFERTGSRHSGKESAFLR